MASVRAVCHGLFLGVLILASCFCASAERGHCTKGANNDTQVCALEHPRDGVDQLEDEAAALLQQPRKGRNIVPAYRKLRAFSRFLGATGTYGGEVGDAYGYCQINSTSNCSVAKLGPDQWTIIDPAGDGSPYDVGVNMKCIDGSPFRFKFWRGSSEKLLIYLQGGGACWNQWSTQGVTVPFLISTGPLCSTSALAQLSYASGPLNMSNASNPYRTHSVLYIPYCSGDGFGGDTVQSYRINSSDPNSSKAIQKGYRHVLAAVDWLQSNGDFSQQSNLKDFALQGCSAGTIGSQVWANNLLSRFAYSQSRVVLDSYAGIFPIEKQGRILTTWGTCDLPILTPAQQAECKDPQGLFILNLTDAALANHSSTRFVTLNSKIDLIQRTFYTATEYDTEAQIVLAVLRRGLAALAPLENTTYYKILNEEVLQKYAASANWQGFLVDGDPHCFNEDQWIVSNSFIGGSFYSGPLGYAPDTGTPEIPEDLVSSNPDPFVCEGEPLDPSEAGDSVTYCDVNMQ
mmetsp:Transcript_54015/g.144710  ORF Transcript_54015/g.144710 Transcript_54015/m.144710 type:complete len:515 (-) Transcript_54015:352-1896(-)